MSTVWRGPSTGPAEQPEMSDPTPMTPIEETLDPSPFVQVVPISDDLGDVALEPLTALDPTPPLPAPDPRRGERRAHAREDRLVLHVPVPVRPVVVAVLAAALAVSVALTGPWTRSDARPVEATQLPATAPLAAAVPGVLGPGTPAPLFPSDVPDPYIVRAGGIYYMFATQPWQEATNIPLRVSSDLVHWRILGDALPILPAWATPGHTWAPSILTRAHDYLMYFTAEQRSTGRECVGTARAGSLRGPFHPDPRILECQALEHAGSIDAQVFVDTDGAAYLFWKSDDNAVHRPSSLWGARLSPDGTALLGTPVTLLHDDQRWENYTIEAPAMVRRAGAYWLFYSGSYLGSAGYSIGYALCATPLGPCAKQTNGAPWFGSGPDGLGPGEESFFTDAYGNTWMAYNAWPSIGAGYYHGFVRYPHVEVVRFTDAAPPQVSPHAVTVVASPVRGSYVLSADGTVYADGGAPSFGWTPVPGELARSMAVMPDGRGYVVLDGYGGIHQFGSAQQLALNPTAYWPGQDVATSIAITPSGRGYAVLDARGVIHRAGDAPADFPTQPPAGDAARALVITRDDKGYAVLLGDGTILGSGDAPSEPARWPGKDAARALVLSPSGHGYAVLDRLGDVTVYGDAPPPPTAQPAFTTFMGLWTGLAVQHGHYLILRSDSFVRN